MFVIKETDQYGNVKYRDFWGGKVIYDSQEEEAKMAAAGILLVLLIMAVYAIVVYVIPVLFGLALSVMALFGIAISLVVTLCLSFIALFKTLFSFEDQVSAPSFLAGIRNFCLFGVLNRLPVLLKTYWGGIFNFVLGSLSPERGFASFCILTAPLLIAAVFLLVLGNVASLLFTALLLGCQAVLCCRSEW